MWMVEGKSEELQGLQPIGMCSKETAKHILDEGCGEALLLAYCKDLKSDYESFQNIIILYGSSIQHH
ncbi:unnamed protein product [Linum trigynum]|uniref:Uncharacterized protein n=1 Tax=Linum trigynum TaxID=586398 RepID=A0AAV2GE95_9ROSI